MNSEVIVGIDLGTTNSAISCIRDGRSQIIPIENESTMPSVVCIRNNRVYIGKSARELMTKYPHNTVASCKRDMGTDTIYIIDDKEYTPIDISALILGKLAKEASVVLGVEVKKAVITVPAYFGDKERHATKQAGEVAGLEVVRIINEPTAAVLAYGFDGKHDSKTQGERYAAVYDLGGGTFDISVVEISDNSLSVISTGGDSKLGGDDFDRLIVDFLNHIFINKFGKNIMRNKVAQKRLRDVAEIAKKELSRFEAYTIRLPKLSYYNEINKDGKLSKKYIDFEYKLTRDMFISLIKGLIDKSMDIMKDTLNQANDRYLIVPDEIILVGGSTKIPYIREELKRKFGIAAKSGINPDKIVAIGAGIQAGKLSGQDVKVVLRDVTSLSLGIQVEDGSIVTLIDKNSYIPYSNSMVFTNWYDFQQQVRFTLLQGDLDLNYTNRILGECILDIKNPAPAYCNSFKVTVNLDSNGTLVLNAVDNESQEQVSLVIEGVNILNEEEIKEKQVKINSLIDFSSQHESISDECNHKYREMLAYMKQTSYPEINTSEYQKIVQDIHYIEQLIDNNESIVEIQTNIDSLYEYYTDYILDLAISGDVDALNNNVNTERNED